MGRFGTLAEAAGIIAFLASDDSGFITAAALPRCRSMAASPKRSPCLSSCRPVRLISVVPVV
jgi:hypothetical protein